MQDSTTRSYEVLEKILDMSIGEEEGATRKLKSKDQSD